MTSSDDVAVSPSQGSGLRVVLGVSGGIAAYKACELLRRFTESGHDVTVVPTAAALEFVGAATWAALSGKPVATEVWTDVHEVPHVRIGQSADLVVVAPATADLLAKAAHGLADDLLTNTLLTARCPVVFAPAMHTEMWEHPATQANVATLRARGALVIEPAEGRLTGADTGKGRLPEPAEIFDVCREVLARGVGRPPTWPAAGSWCPPAAPASTSTRSASSATAPRACRATRWPGPPPRAAPRSPWSPPTSRCPTRPGVKVVRVETTAQLRDEVVAAAGSADAVVMAAAPADFRPTAVSDAKIKKAADGSAPAIELAQNPDILARDQHRPRPRRLGHRGLRRRDRRRHRVGARPRPRQAGPQGLRPARRQRRQRGSGLRQPRQRGRDPRRRRRRRRRAPRARRRRWPTSSGTKWPAAARLRPVVPRFGTAGIVAVHHHRTGVSSTCGWTSLHVGVGDRGSPGQDRRPDQRLGPRRDARAGPAQPGRGRDAADHRPGRGRRRGRPRPATSTSRRSCATGSSRSATTPRSRASTASPAASWSPSAASPATSPRASTPATRAAPAPWTRWTSRAPATRA